MSIILNNLDLYTASYSGGCGWVCNSENYVVEQFPSIGHATLFLSELKKLAHQKSNVIEVDEFESLKLRFDGYWAKSAKLQDELR